MTRVKYVSCIMCGKTIAENKFSAEPFSIDPGDYIILQVRNVVGGRKGQGFWNIPEEGKTIKELWEGDEREREIAEVLKGRLLTVLRSYISLGIVSKEEI